MNFEDKKNLPDVLNLCQLYALKPTCKKRAMNANIDSENLNCPTGITLKDDSGKCAW